MENSCFNFYLALFHTDRKKVAFVVLTTSFIELLKQIYFREFLKIIDDDITNTVDFLSGEGYLLLSYRLKLD